MKVSSNTLLLAAVFLPLLGVQAAPANKAASLPDVSGPYKLAKGSNAQPAGSKAATQNALSCPAGTILSSSAKNKASSSKGGKQKREDQYFGSGQLNPRSMSRHVATTDSNYASTLSKRAQDPPPPAFIGVIQPSLYVGPGQIANTDGKQSMWTNHCDSGICIAISGFLEEKPPKNPLGRYILAHITGQRLLTDFDGEAYNPRRQIAHLRSAIEDSARAGSQDSHNRDFKIQPLLSPVKVTLWAAAASDDNPLPPKLIGNLNNAWNQLVAMFLEIGGEDFKTKIVQQAPQALVLKYWGDGDQCENGWLVIDKGTGNIRVFGQKR